MPCCVVVVIGALATEQLTAAADASILQTYHSIDWQRLSQCLQWSGPHRIPDMGQSGCS